MISLDIALERVLATATPLERETGTLSTANGRVLAEPLTARVTQPPFNASAMDGYAVRSADVRAGATLEQVGTAQAGAGFSGEMPPGRCVRIFTGAPVPDDADAVVMQENTEALPDGRIRFSSDAAPGRSIRRRGQDFAEGHPLIAAGTRLNARHIALTAAANCDQLALVRAPRVALLATGDELVPAGSRPGADQIIASNSVGLAALFSPWSAEVRDLGIVRDDEAALTKCLSSALAGDADVLVTTGGASVGDHDLVQPVLISLGVEMDFWKIAIRPGKPLMFGTLGRKLVFGLPGNPVSAMVTAAILVLPALRALSGQSDPVSSPLRLPVSTSLPGNGERRHFIRAKLGVSGGATCVLPISETDSAHLSSLAGSDGLIVRPEHAPAVHAGGLVDFLPHPGL